MFRILWNSVRVTGISLTPFGSPEGESGKRKERDPAGQHVIEGTISRARTLRQLPSDPATDRGVSWGRHSGDMDSILGTCSELSGIRYVSPECAPKSGEMSGDDRQPSAWLRFGFLTPRPQRPPRRLRNSRPRFPRHNLNSLLFSYARDVAPFRFRPQYILAASKAKSPRRTSRSGRTLNVAAPDGCRSSPLELIRYGTKTRPAEAHHQLIGRIGTRGGGMV